MPNSPPVGFLTNPATLVELLRRRSELQPQAEHYTFLVSDQETELTWSYSMLDQKARAIAALLQASIRPGERVLLLYPPGLDYLAAFFGCLYAGIIAVPIFPPSFSRPALRLQAILADSGAVAALTTDRLLADAPALIRHTPGLATLRWLATDNLARDLADQWRAAPIDGESIAFLQYTSGSTGTPKGVMLSHRNLLHNLSLIHRFYGMSPESQGVIWLVPYHDMGLIGGILAPLYGGFPVTLMPPVAFLQKPLRWLQTISRCRGTISGGPNFAYSLCLTKIPPEEREGLDLSSWQVAFNGAEPVREQTMRSFAEAFAPYGFRYEAFYPCYGLAEATLIVAGGLYTEAPITQTVAGQALAQHQVIAAADSAPDTHLLVSAGRSAPSQDVVIVNPQTRAAVTGGVGEIWVRGPSIARGYWGRPAETDETFGAYLADDTTGPFLRTGDLGFLLRGELFVTGRLKDLIIIRGKNHYPQDIELTVEQSHFALAPGCGAAFSIEIAGEERLVVVQELNRRDRHSDPQAITQAIRQAVAEQHGLQVYAISLLKPASIFKTTSGKIQRRACKVAYLDGTLAVISHSVLDAEPGPALAPEIDLDVWQTAEPAQRRTLIEATLRDMIAGLVQQRPSEIDRDLPLISLGLDSLLSVELSHRLASIQVEISPTELLGEISLAQLAQHIDATLGEARPYAGPSAIQPIAMPERAQLSFAQQRLWFLERLAPGNPAYHIPAVIRLVGTLDAGALERSFTEVVRRHEVLRTTFALAGEQPIQLFHPPAPMRIVEHDLAEIDATRQQQMVAELTSAAARESFDLQRGPLLRVWLLRLAADEHRLLLTLHHIVADGWSMGVLVREVTALYEAFSSGKPSPLPELPVQYADFAGWQRRYLQDEILERHSSYWQQTLAHAPRVLALPTDRPRPHEQTFEGEHIALTLPPALTAALRALARQEQTTLFMTLLAGFQTVLHYHTRQSQIVVGTDVANRTATESKALIGFFANQLVLCTDMSGDPSFGELLQRVRQVTLGAFAHQDLPFNKIVEIIRPDRDASRNPLFQVLFVLENSPMPSLTLPGLTTEVLEAESPGSPFDMSLLLTESGDVITGIWRYNSRLFDPSTVRRLIGQYQHVLEAAARQPAARLSTLLAEIAAFDRESQQVHASTLRAAHAAKFQQLKRSMPSQSQS
ncbi:MAG TPA: condensation domain-containing protein [Herpetosiphonaceae bacterium]